jgi:hypothetical protein
MRPIDDALYARLDDLCVQSKALHVQSQALHARSAELCFISQAIRAWHELDCRPASRADLR